MLGAPGACTPLPTELDVMILADMTGSHAGTISSNARVLATELAAPLLMDSSVRVGVAYFADFPVGFYGSMGDVPFGGSIAPTTDPMAVGAALMSLPMMSGGDLPESGVEALYVLAGGTPHPLARAMTCPSGTLTGGCWRPGAQRIVVMLTDVAQHNAPSSAVPPGTLVAPYGPDLTPPSPVWIDARSAMLSQGVALFAIVPNTSPSGPMEDPSAQLQLLITELGGNPATQIVTYPLAFPVDLTTAAREMAMRIATFAMLPP